MKLLPLVERQRVRNWIVTAVLLEAPVLFSGCAAPSESQLSEPAKSTVTESAAALQTPTQLRSPAEQDAAAAANPRRSVVDRMWWNQPPKIASLKLTAEQRDRMDELLAAVLQERAGWQMAQKAAVSGYLEQVLADPQRRPDAEARVRAALSDPTVLQLEMMISVLEQLSPRQQQILRLEHPMLLEGLWLRPSPRARKGRTPAKRPAGGGNGRDEP